MKVSDQSASRALHAVSIDVGDTLIRDELICESPLQITINGQPYAVLMRTPSTAPFSDIDLTLGFLFSEGIIEDFEDIASLGPCSDPNKVNPENSMRVHLKSGCTVPAQDQLGHRSTPISSACGVCGVSSLNQFLQTLPTNLPSPKPSSEFVQSLPSKLRTCQRLFARTGGVHAAALVDHSGQIITFSEDIGRHNAMDKLVGWAFRTGSNLLDGGIVVVSSRISFDLVQKALLAGVSVLVGVGAASSLAHDLAKEKNLHLFSFTRQDRTNYHPIGSEVS